MQTNSYDDWMRRPLSAAGCPTPDIWPDVPPTSLFAQSRGRKIRTPQVSVFAAQTQQCSDDRKELKMNEEKARILKMLEDKKITAEEAMKLLDALDRTDARPSDRELRKKWLHIRVEKDGRQTVNIKLPLALLKFGFKFVPQHSRSRHMRAHFMAERAKERAERARERAEQVRARVESRLREKFGEEAEINLNGVFDEAFSGIGVEPPEPPRHPGSNGVHAALEGIFDGDTDLDLDKILEMAQDPAFDGKVLDVYDDDEDEHVTISLE